MAVVTGELGRAAATDWLTAVLAVVAFALVFGTRIHPAWLIAGGGAVGFAAHTLIL